MGSFADALNMTSGLSFAIGFGESGAPICVNLETAPHILIAGATGTGKSVLARNILLTLISHNAKDSLQMILCDTKLVEFGLYRGVQNLSIPPCTSAESIERALAYVDYEISRRLSLFCGAGKRDLSSYNDYAWEKFIDGAEAPRLLVVIDDLADLISSRPVVIPYIQKIMQSGRTAGVHLIAITQTPTQRNVKQVSLAFRVKIVFPFSSKSEESLLIGAKRDFGLGDVGRCVFSSGGVAQAVIVVPAGRGDEQEILSRARAPGIPDGPEVQMVGGNQSPGDIGSWPPVAGENDDGLLDDAVDVVLEAGQASASILQRRLKIGYARATRLIDKMESLGYVGPFMGSTPRKILITKNDLQRLRQEGERRLAPEGPVVEAEILKEGHHEEGNRRNQGRLSRILFGRKRME